MGIIANIQTALGYGLRPDMVASPFAQGALNQIAWSEIFGSDTAPISRGEAMAIPAVRKARNLICGTIAQFPLRAANASGVLPDEQQPTWMYRTNNGVAPFYRTLWTLDDLLFFDQSLWTVVRGSEGQILTADRVPFERWKVDASGAILVDNEAVDADEVIYFGGINGGGLLDHGATALREARSIERTVTNRAATPVPVMEIHATTDDVTPEEGKALVEAYNNARRDPEGATVYTPVSVTLNALGAQADGQFMTEARNGVRINVANLTGVPVALLDGSTSTASLTYSTAEGRRNEFVDYGLSIWINAFEARLSLDDVVPRGQSTVLDLSDFLTTLPSPTGPREQD